MQTRPRSVAVSCLLAMLFVLPVALMPAGALPVSDAQQDLIEDFYDVNAPKGNWQHFTESAEFFLTGGGDADSPSNPEGGAPIQHSLVPETGATLGSDVGPLGLGGPSAQAIFGPDSSLVVLPTVGEHTRDETLLYTLEGQFWVSGLHEQAVLEVEVIMKDQDGGVLDLNPSTSETSVFINARPAENLDLVTVRIIDTYISQAIRYEGNFDFGFEGRMIPAGAQFEMVITPLFESPTAGVGATLPGGATVHYGNGDRPSRLIARGEFAHVNAWVEDQDGDVTNSFPSAYLDFENNIPAKVADRQFVVQVAHANSWGPTQLRLPGIGANNLHSARLFHDDGARWLSGGTGLQTGGDHSLHQVLGDGSVEVSTHHYFYPALKDAEGKSQFPDGDYQMELFSSRQRWVYSMPSIAFDVGATGFEFELAAAEEADHATYLGEPTSYELLLTNTGSAPETVGLSVPVGGGWQADFSKSNFKIQPGATEAVTFTVTPPTAGVDGQSRDFVVSASATRDRSIKTLTLGVELTDVKTFGVEMTPSLNAVETRPGLVEEFPITLRNSGNARDSYVVRTANVPTGWEVSVLPTTLEVLSQSREDINLRITPPADAEPGVGFTLDVIATRILDSSVRDTITLPVTIFVVDGVSVQVMESAHNIRNAGPRNCESDVALIGFSIFTCTDTSAINYDSDHDLTSLYRVRAENPGDRPDTFTLTWDWASGHCGNGNSPSTWLLRADPAIQGGSIGDVSGAAPSLPGSAMGDKGTIGTIQLDAHEVRYLHFELGYSEASDVCSASGSQRSAGAAAVDVIARSGNDPTLTSVTRLAGARVTAGSFGSPPVDNEYTGATHKVHIAPDLGHGISRFAASGDPFALVSPADDEFYGDVPAEDGYEYVFRATNMGNERDTLRFRLSGGASGWDYDLDIRTEDQDRMYATAHQGKGPCSEITNRDWRCQLGVWDEVVVRVIANPPDDARIGSKDIVDLTVISMDDSTIQDTVEIHSRVLGEYAYDLIGHSTQLKIRPNGTASFPFTIENLGTEHDTYTLSTTVQPDTWVVRYSEPTQQIFVPAGTSYRGFYTVEAPDGLVGTEADQLFRLQVESVASGLKQVEDLFVDPQPAQELALVSAGALIQSGNSGLITVTADDLANDAATVTFAARSNILPGGWSATRDGDATKTFDTNGQAQINYNIAVPEGEIDTSRQILRVTATTDTGEQAEVDVVIDLASTFGVSVAAPDGDELAIVPGSTVTYTLEVENQGLSKDIIQLDMSSPTGGWAGAFSQETVTLQPLESKEVEFTVTAPATATVGQSLTSVIFVSSSGDGSETDQITLVTSVAEFDPEFRGLPERIYVAPDEATSIVATIVNNGTGDDDINVSAALPAAFRDNFAVTIEPESVALGPGEGADITISFQSPVTIAQDTVVTFGLTGTSGVSPTGVTGSGAFDVVILKHAIQDVDGDLLMEVAVDRDRDESNGMEEFRESSEAGGIRLAPADLQRFLTDDARDDKTVTVVDSDGNETDVLVYFVDGDEDGRIDYFLDAGADALPDRYWDPDNQVTHKLSVTKDVTGDSVREYFVDVDGDGKLDRYFDITVGEFGELLQVDFNDDGITDYVVDLDDDGIADDSEPVIIVGISNISFVEKRDVDGDGKLDAVVDADGDGVPDYFIRNGATTGIAIVLRDVDADGSDEWTFDLDGDGKRESYYDPVDNESGLIDARSAFVSGLLEYWYVAAIFLVVLALFVVLLIVTRR